MMQQRALVRTLPVLMAILVLAACRGRRSDGGASVDTAGFVSLAPPAPLDSTLRIIVTDQPQVYVDGRLVSLTALDSMLAALELIDGVVWFYQQPAEIHLAARQDSLVDSVLTAVHRHELAIWPSRSADFGDLVGKRRRPSPPGAP